MFAIKNQLNAESLIWDWEMARLLQVLHADGIARGNRYRWSHYYEASEINSILETAEKQPFTWEELDR